MIVLGITCTQTQMHTYTSEKLGNHQKLIFSFKIIFNFWNYNYICTFSFLPPSYPIYHSPFSFKFMASLSTKYYCMHTCICIYVYIPNCLVHTMLLVCILRANFLSLVNQWLLIPREDHLSYFKLSPVTIFLRVGLRPHGFFSTQFAMFISVIVVYLRFWWSCWWDFMCGASDITWRHNLIAKFPILWIFYYLHTLLHNVPWISGVGKFCSCIHWDQASHLSFWLVRVLCNSLYVAKRTFLYEEWRLYLPVNIRKMIIDCS